MVKIVELTNEQLVASIEKYQTIIDELYKEREKRLGAGASIEEVYTKGELEKMKQNNTSISDSDQFALNLGDDDIEAIETVKNETSIRNKSEDDDELVRVTTLLRLSKEQLAELNKAKEERDKSNRPASKPKGKKVDSLSFSKGRIKIKK